MMHQVILISYFNDSFAIVILQGFVENSMGSEKSTVFRQVHGRKFSYPRATVISVVI